MENWYYNEKRNTLEKIKDSSLEKIEYEMVDETVNPHYICGSFFIYFRISDINKTIPYKKIMSTNTDLELILITGKAQLFYNFQNEQDITYTITFSNSLLEVKKNYNYFITNNDMSNYRLNNKNLSIKSKDNDIIIFQFIYLFNLTIIANNT
jgi:hypothetical protein